MSTISPEHQRQLARHLGQLRRNAPDAAKPDEDAESSGQMSSLGTASFIMLGGFALLKDIFDFVFVGSSWATKAAGTAGQVGTGLEFAGLMTMLYTWWTGGGLAIGAIINRLGWAASGVETVLSGIGASLDAERIILPFVFTNMFMIIVVAVLLLSGLGLKSYKVFLSSRTIILSLIAIIIEIVPMLNIFPWMTIYVILLFIHVKRLLKEQEKEKMKDRETEQPLAQPI